MAWIKLIIVAGLLLGMFFAGVYIQGKKNFKNNQEKLDAFNKKLHQEKQAMIAEADAEKRKLEDERKAWRTEQTEREKKQQDKYAAQQNKLSEKQRQIQQQLNAAQAKLEAAKAEAQRSLSATRQAEQAIQRRINGYGDQYLIPSVQLIDDIAQEYSIHNAGEKLKTCRKQVRDSIQSGNATSGDAAVSKVLLDFFNTKAEQLLAEVKHENYGKLKQELADIYALTEYHAKAAAFAGAVRKDYYQLRQEELKWASVLHTLRTEEREQQRAIREQAREEERARKEYEKAMRDAAKEESMLQKAMDKARAELERATAEQRAQYESQLADLSQKLKEAEEKNQRALSMAQQTRAGHVYLISNIGSFGENMVKIGMTRRLEPLDRVRELGDASVPFLFDVHAIIYSDDAPALEKQLHRAFSDARVNKVNHRKEFFRVSPQQLKDKLAELGIQAQFTLAAEAAEYRETLRIEAMAHGERDKILNHLLEQET